jgi:hypothetical protein
MVEGCPWIPAGLGGPLFYLHHSCWIPPFLGSPGIPSHSLCLLDPGSKNTRVPRSPRPTHVFLDPRTHKGAPWVPGRSCLALLALSLPYKLLAAPPRLAAQRAHARVFDARGFACAHICGRARARACGSSPISARASTTHRSRVPHCIAHCSRLHTYTRTRSSPDDSYGYNYSYVG